MDGRGLGEGGDLAPFTIGGTSYLACFRGLRVVQFQAFGVILPVNDWATILPCRTTNVSVPNS